jgi:hypothetical protein
LKRVISVLPVSVGGVGFVVANSPVSVLDTCFGYNTGAAEVMK